MSRICKVTQWEIVVLLVCNAAGCATTAPPVDTGFVPNDREGLVYGRMEFVVDGTTVPPGTRHGLIKPEVDAELSKYTGLDQLNENAWKPGEFVIRAPVSGDGHFAAKLPVGRYYFVGFTYLGAGGGHAGLAFWRTYTQISQTHVSRPMLITFEVVPNKATYLGTVRHLVTVGSNSTTTQEFSFDLQLVDDSAAETARLLQQYSHLKGMTEPHLPKVDLLNSPLQAR
jgi:hypothetical protein